MTVRSDSPARKHARATSSSGRRPTPRRSTGSDVPVRTVPPRRSASADGSSRPTRTTPPSRRPPSRRSRRTLTIVLLALAALLVALVVVLVGRSCSPAASEPVAASTVDAATAASSEQAASPQTDASTQVAASGSLPAYTVVDRGSTASGEGRVSFSAVGDSIANDNILELADAWSGTTDDGAYDFSPLFRDLKGTVTNDYDLSLINQETTMGGTENFGYMGYPSYNTPDSMAQAIADAGWRMVATDSNHTYDTWVDAILHSQGVWENYPDIVTAGSYASEEDRQTVRVLQCNGIRISFLAYTYGQNGYSLDDLPNNYYAVAYSEEGLAEDVARAREVSDVVLVYMHWGTEYTHDVTEEQQRFAQLAADDGVDIVVGSHCHWIQPVEWVEGSGGNQMLCAYGLGDLVSGYHNHPETVLSGMLSCDFVKDSQTGDVSVQNVVWHPLIEHMEAGDDRVCLVRDYTEDMASRNELLQGTSTTCQWLRDTTSDVIGDGITIDM